MRLKDKVVIVTGAGSGIGEGIAKRLAEEGAKVVVNDLLPAGGQRVTEEILTGGGMARFIQGDVTSSAGWTHRNQPMLEVSEEDFDRCYAVNVKSIYLSAMHATPVFRRQGGGVFINIASTAGVRPRPGLTWYNGSKSAVIGTSKSMAVELGPDNIRVNCINPVFNPDTALSTSFIGGEITEERRAKFLSTIPLGRFSTALDVANAALYLASDEAAFISGVCIEVDGARCV
jgi:3-oxoacyl-[acyl-carrier protein] reductase